MNYFLVFLGGGLGSVCRYFVADFFNQRSASLFPAGTFAVNLTGSFIIGFLFNLFQTFVIPAEARVLIMIGFLGGFTTFSSYSLESVNLFLAGEQKLMLLNVLMTNVSCLMITVAGMYLSNILTRVLR